MQRFRVHLKTFFGLAMPNQYSQTVRKQTSSWFWEIILGQNPHTFMIPIYSTTILYDRVVSYSNRTFSDSSRVDQDIYSMKSPIALITIHLR